MELGTKYISNPVDGIVSAMPYGEYFAPLVGIVAAVILFIAANAGLIGSSRLSFSMGEYYQLPRLFFKIHPKKPPLEYGYAKQAKKFLLSRKR